MNPATQVVEFRIEVYRHGKQHQRAKDVQDNDPRCLPKGGQQFQAYGTRIVHPHPLAVGGTDLEAVRSFGQVDVRGGALATHIMPVVIESFEHVGIVDSQRVAGLHGGIVDGECPLVGLQLQVVYVVGFCRNPFTGDVRRVFIQMETRNDDGRHIVALLHLVGVERKEPGVGGHRQPTGRELNELALAEHHREADGVGVETVELVFLDTILC